MQNTPRISRYNRRQAARDAMAPNDDHQSLYDLLAKVAEGNIQQNQQIQALTENMNKMAQSVSNSRIEKRLTLQNCPKMKTRGESGHLDRGGEALGQCCPWRRTPEVSKVQRDGKGL